jgi:hypothetical protein
MNQGFTIEDNARAQIWSFINQNTVKIRDIQAIFNNSVKQHISNYNGDENNKYLISSNDLVFPQPNALKPKIKLNIKPKT